MPAKTANKAKATIEIKRTNGNVIQRNINITNLVQDAIIEHLSTEFGLTLPQMNALIESWFVRTMWFDEPEV